MATVYIMVQPTMQARYPGCSKLPAHLRMGNNLNDLFCFFLSRGEESGLLGSGFYTENPFFDMNKTVACINTDVILFLGKFNDVTVTGFGQSELDKWLEKEAVKQGGYCES